MKKITLYIKGMHCDSCDILVTDKFKEFPNIKEVHADHTTQTVEVSYTGEIDKKALNNKIQEYGYEIGDKRDDQESLSKKMIDISAIAGILFILYYFGQELNIIPHFATNTGSQMTYLSVFLLGLVASTSTCMATSGALFVSTVKDLPASEKNKTSLLFNAGRVVSYGVFGYIAGLIGTIFSVSLGLGQFLSLFVGAFMIIVALDMLEILPTTALTGGSIKKNIFAYFRNKLQRYPRQTAILLGALTYFLPCGFTQSVQLYALNLANPTQSALLMMSFALGTVPALLAVGYASSFTKNRFYTYFIKVIGVLLLMVGLSSFNNIAHLYGFQLSSVSLVGSQPQQTTNILEKDGYQLASMNVNAAGYWPKSFVVKKDIPVRWVIHGENVFGCQGTIVAPKIGVQKTLTNGDNIIEFTPKEVGKITFSCTMGMYNGEFQVVEG